MSYFSGMGLLPIYHNTEPVYMIVLFSLFVYRPKCLKSMEERMQWSQGRRSTRRAVSPSTLRSIEAGKQRARMRRNSVCGLTSE